jgi:hypothetical protein
MDEDSTGQARRDMIASGQPQKDLAEARDTWTTAELTEDFEVLQFAAPFVLARRKDDGKTGILEFARGDDGVRRYFGWKES